MSAATVQIVVPENAESDDVDFVAGGLYTLSRRLGERNPDAQAHGVLGGQWGYGQHFENEVFEMHPYYWGDCTCGHDERQDAWDKANHHAAHCYQFELSRARQDAGLDVFWPEYARGWLSGSQARRAEKSAYRQLCAKYDLPEQGWAVHCTCGCKQRIEEFDATNLHDPKCPEVVPNFRHKASGLEVRWYKWIGRGMELSRDVSREEWAHIFAECMASVTGAP
jgi:hypothetical protein